MQQRPNKRRAEIKDKKLIGKMVEAAHRMAEAIDTSPEPFIQALRKVEQKISGLADLVAETQNRALLAKLDELETERNRLQDERATAEERATPKRGLRSLRTQDVAAMLEFAAQPLDGQPALPACRYTVGVGGATMASPRGFEPRLPP
jgi:hypothetical protein